MEEKNEVTNAPAAEDARDVNLSEQRVDMLVTEREHQKEIMQKKHELLLKTDVGYRRNYYQHELFMAYQMLPEENYYKTEYREITEKYNKAFDKMETLTEEEDLKKVIDEFKSKTKKIMPERIGFDILIGIFVLAVVGFVVYCIIRGKNM